MEPLVQLSSKRVNRWNYDYISPGPVGSVGDVIQDIKLYSSTPDDPIRWMYNDRQLQRMGSAITDGSIMNPFNRGLSATTIIQDPYSDDWEQTQTGVFVQDIRPNDLEALPREKGMPQGNWKTLTAQNDWSPFGKYGGPVIQSGTISRGNEPQTFLAVGNPGTGFPDYPEFPGGVSAPRPGNGVPTLGMKPPPGMGGGIGPGVLAPGGAGLNCLRP